jgi:hypothetical protein
VGQLFTGLKEFVGHGLFLNWLEANLDISERSAQQYMKLYRYQDKTANIADLQTAYKQIETIEAQEKQSKEEPERLIDRHSIDTKTGGEKRKRWTEQRQNSQ